MVTSREGPVPIGLRRAFLTLVLVPFLVDASSAQSLESIGSKALGMGGAFVAVANDSTATWWNPAGLADGPFLDLVLGHAATDIGNGEPGRETATWVALGTPPFGVSYYRFRIADAEPPEATEPQEGGVVVPSRSVSQLGATLVHTVVSGVHAGATLKHVRGEEGHSGQSRGAFDLDVGALALIGPVRVGAVVRNARAAEVGGTALPRQVRVGAAFNAAAAGLPPWTLTVDVDARAYQSAFGERRVVALGGEGLVGERRVALRAGARFNTVGSGGQVVTAGATVPIRSGLVVDGHVVRGGAGDERGWGVAARMSF